MRRSTPHMCDPGDEKTDRTGAEYRVGYEIEQQLQAFGSAAVVLGIQNALRQYDVNDFRGLQKRVTC